MPVVVAVVAARLASGSVGNNGEGGREEMSGKGRSGDGVCRLKSKAFDRNGDGGSGSWLPSCKLAKGA